VVLYKQLRIPLFSLLKDLAEAVFEMGNCVDELKTRCDQCKAVKLYSGHDSSYIDRKLHEVKSCPDFSCVEILLNHVCNADGVAKIFGRFVKLSLTMSCKPLLSQ